MNIGFLSNQIGLRGTEVAMFDYAKYNEELLGNNSIIATFGRELNESAFNKFKDRFDKVHIISENESSLNKFVDDNKIDILYKICFGNPETLPTNCKTAIHAVFNTFNPFGNVYAYVSEYIRDKSVPLHLRDQYSYVPHIIYLPDIDSNLRSLLNIPQDATVFGYHGGKDSFNMDFVKKCIIDVLEIKKDIYFIFMNVDKFYDHSRIVFLEGNSDLEYKTKFINSCDAMIHARSIGETFGIACGEFSLRNKPVIAYANGIDTNHLNILNDKAITYSNYYDLLEIFKNFKDYSEPDADWNCYRDFSPDKVMQRFKKVFID